MVSDDEEENNIQNEKEKNRREIERKKEVKKSEIPLFDKISKSACVVVGMSRYEASKHYHLILI